MNYKQEVERLIREIVSDESLSDVENDMLYNMALIMSGQTLNDFAADLESNLKRGFSIDEIKTNFSNIITTSI